MIIDNELITKLSKLNPTANLSFKTMEEQYLIKYLNKAKLIGYEVTRIHGAFCIFNNQNTIMISSEKFKLLNMYNLFFWEKFKSIDISNTDTTELKNMEGAFRACRAKHINIKEIKTDKVFNMEGMFSGCKNIDITGIDNFDPSNTSYMTGMFRECTVRLDLDLRHFNTSKVVAASEMFYRCKAPKVDISTFKIKDMTRIERIFAYSDIGCIDLSNVVISEKAITSELFKNCTAKIKLPKDIKSAERIITELNTYQHNVDIVYT